jgi:hypothetical protein
MYPGRLLIVFGCLHTPLKSTFLCLHRFPMRTQVHRAGQALQKRAKSTYLASLAE